MSLGVGESHDPGPFHPVVDDDTARPARRELAILTASLRISSNCGSDLLHRSLSRTSAHTVKTDSFCNSTKSKLISSTRGEYVRSVADYGAPDHFGRADSMVRDVAVMMGQGNGSVQRQTSVSQLMITDLEGKVVPEREIPLQSCRCTCSTTASDQTCAPCVTPTRQRRRVVPLRDEHLKKRFFRR